ncbi:MAG: hypothetical protein IKU51_04665 [Clostridia bacterium]|nr:hypothetical protein [Clostridia bacterium]
MLERWKSCRNFPKNGGKLGGKCEKPLILEGFSKNWAVKVIGFRRLLSAQKNTKSYTRFTIFKMGDSDGKNVPRSW